MQHRLKRLPRNSLNPIQGLIYLILALELPLVVRMLGLPLYHLLDHDRFTPFLIQFSRGWGSTAPHIVLKLGRHAREAAPYAYSPERPRATNKFSFTSVI